MKFDYVFLPAGPIRRYCQLIRLYAAARPIKLLTFHFDPALWPALLHGLFPRRDLAFYMEKTWEPFVRHSRYKETLKKILFSAADMVFVPGVDAAGYVHRYRSDRRDMGKLPHVVDVDALRVCRDLRTTQPRLRLLYLGKVIKEKGVLDLISALASLADIHSELSLLVVGSGYLSSEVESFGSEAGFEFEISPFVQASDLAPVFARADVLVFPTHGDTFGLVVGEALAAGLAVISTTAAGEIIERVVGGPEGERGILIEAGDVSALADSIRALNEDRRRLQSMQEQAATYADRVLPIFHWVAAIEAWCA